MKDSDDFLAGFKRGAMVGYEKGKKELADEIKRLLDINECSCEDCTKD